MKVDTPSSIEQSPRSVGMIKNSRGKGQRRPRKPKVLQAVPPGPSSQGPILGPGGLPVSQVPVLPMQNSGGQVQSSHMGYGPNSNLNQSLPPFNQGGQQQWFQQPQSQNFYPQQMNPNVSRYERPPVNQSKQALSNMLRQRQPLNQFMNQNQMVNFRKFSVFDRKIAINLKFSNRAL